MAYNVHITTSNGYRCSCCQHFWDRDSWIQDLEEALNLIPLELKDGEPHPFNGDAEVTSVTVIDGSTGEKIAWASARWSSGFERGSGYKYTCWSGYRPDLGSFEVVYARGGERVEESWESIMTRLREAHKVQERAKAQRELEAAQKRLRSLE